MRVAVAGHVTLDTIESDDYSVSSVGGPPCYAGLVARKLGYDVALLTKMGWDFGEENMAWLSRNQLEFVKPFLSPHPSTRFRIVQSKDSRELILTSRCEDLDISQLENIDGDGLVVSSVAGEVSLQFMKKASNLFRHVCLDPQGHLRSFTSHGRCFLESKLDLETLKYVNMIKVGKEELPFVAGTTDRKKALARLRRKGPEHVILTASNDEVWIASDDTIHSVKTPSIRPTDTTGVGDIFVGTYLAEFLRKTDSIWATCMGMAASFLSLENVGISKIPGAAAIRDKANQIVETVGRVE